jgi:DNA-directed RNA polymerase specialized sigma24 family protein
MSGPRQNSGERWKITRENFAGLLRKLGSDSGNPFQAGQRYEALRMRLIFYFTRKCLDFPEDLADEVLDRLTRRVAEGFEIDSLTGFALGIARFVAREQSAKPFQPQLMESTFFDNIPASSVTHSEEEKIASMENCLHRMASADVELLESYYLGSGGRLISARRRLAEALNVPQAAVRQRVFLIRKRLRQCIERQRKRAPGRISSAGPESGRHG